MPPAASAVARSSPRATTATRWLLAGLWFALACGAAPGPDAGADAGGGADAAGPAPIARITTLAGINGDQPGFADGPALGGAEFDMPEGLLLDAARQHLYVADSGNHALRRLDLATMEVITVAGIGTVRGSNDTTGQGATLVPARLNNPRNLVMAPGGDGLYFTDAGNHVIRHLDLITLEVTTVVGMAGQTGSTDGVGADARFGADGLFATWPGAMVIDEDDPVGPTLYVADSANQTLRAVDLSTRTVRTVAGQVGQLGAADGPAAQATFNKPAGLALDGAGGLLVAEANNLTVRRLDLASGQVTTVAGKAPADPRHYCENISPVLPPECGAIDAARGTDARFRFPYALAPDHAGGVLLVDSHNNLIRRLDPRTTAVTSIAGVQATLLDDIPHGSADSDAAAGVAGTFWHPTHAVAASATGDVLFVADRSASCIRRVELGVR